MVRCALLAGIAIAAVALAFAAPILEEPRTDPNTRWETQEWPQRGLQTENLRVSTGEFTNAEHLNPADGAATTPQAWLFTLEQRMGFTLVDPDIDRRPVIYGEVTTVNTPVTAPKLGPHGLMAVGTDRGMYFISTVANPTYPNIACQGFFAPCPAVCQPIFGFYPYPYERSVFGARHQASNFYWENFTRFSGPPILLAIDASEREQAVCDHPSSLYSDASVGYFFAWNATVSSSSPVFDTYIMGQVAGKNPLTGGLVADIANAAFTGSTPWAPFFSRGLAGSAYYPVAALPVDFQGEQAHIGFVGTSGATPTFDPDLGFATGGIPGSVTAYVLEDMSPIWSTILFLGSSGGIIFNSTLVFYEPSTSPVANEDLLVIGGTGMLVDEDGNTDIISNRLFALHTFDGPGFAGGDIDWTYDTETNRVILPHPVILKDRVIFGTNAGRAYALDHDGNLKWRSAQLEFAPRPFTDPTTFEKVELYGPATDRANQFVYFGGNDGRVHQFNIATGDHKESEIFWYYGAGFNANGNQIYRPGACTSAPAIYQDQFLVVKTHTQIGGNSDNTNDMSCLMILSLPSMQFEPDLAVFNAGYQVDATDDGIGCTAGEQAVNVAFCDGAKRVGGIFMTEPWIGYPWSDPITRLEYLGATGVDAYQFNATVSDGPAFSKFAKLSRNDAGGVSISNGFVLATNRNGTIMGIPSAVPHDTSVAASSLKNELGLPPVDVVAPLGPLRVYPNPFNPGTAVGGVAKFKNLTRGSTVTLYTLAFERVRVLHELDHEAFWDGRNEAGQDVATGVYLYKIIDPEKGQAVTGRLALTRK